MTSNGKQFTVTREMLTAVAGISARYSKFAFVLFCYITNHLMTGPLGNSEFCFPRISMFPLTSSLFPKGVFNMYLCSITARVTHHTTRTIFSWQTLIKKHFSLSFVNSEIHKKLTFGSYDSFLTLLTVGRDLKK